MRRTDNLVGKAKRQHPGTAGTGHRNDLGRFPPIAQRGPAASRTFTRSRRPMVGCEGPRVCPAGRRPRGFVGARLSASQGRRSEQGHVLVWSGGEARVPTITRCGMAQHRERIAGVDIDVRPSQARMLKVGPEIITAHRLPVRTSPSFTTRPIEDRRSIFCGVECARE